MFFKEEIPKFQIAYFENICTALDTEKGIFCFCRDTFVRTKGIIPKIDKDALGIIALDLEFRYMFDTKHKFDRWGFVQVPRGLIDEYADRILVKIVVRRRFQEEEEARRQAKAIRRPEAIRKVTAEAARKAEEARLIVDACLRLREEAAAGVAASTKKIPLPQMKARFSSLAELLDDIRVGGRDLFLADLVKNHDSANYTNYYNDYGVIYVIICLVDFKVYVG